MQRIYDILSGGIHSCVLSQKQKTAKCDYNKVQVKPFLKNDEIFYQFSFFTEKKVAHKNLDTQEASDMIEKELKENFFQCVIFGAENDVHLTSFGKKVKFKNSPPTKKIQNLSHDKRKNYIIAEDEKADFLIELGVFSKEGKLKKDKYPKFRQINKYLEFIDALKDKFPKDKPVRVVDFGCGKAYLSFALYYYLTKKLGLQADILGLDLKEDVVNNCMELSNKLGYQGLKFQTGDIGKFESDFGFDMVISLHACDTATDEAIYKGVLWKSKLILAVPCCQHELNSQLKNEKNHGVLRYGLMRERLATILTDTARALLLESVGYKCEVEEFIETVHTPKNVLIKAKYTGDKSKKSMEQYRLLKKEWNFEHKLEKLLGI